MSTAANTPRSAGAKPRQTQAERSSETRRRVCEATLEALAELPYDQVSTTLIAKRAKVSRGALTHQFPMRNDLLVAAFQYLLDGWQEDYPFGCDLDTTRLSVEELVDALWENLFSNEKYIAAMALMLAARQDTELGRTLRQAVDKWVGDRDRAAVTLIGGSPEDEEAVLLVQLHLAVLRGIAHIQSLETDENTAAKLIGLWKRIATGRP